jgi:branched-chain amino acid transport system ATP-binding protein
VLSLAAVEGGYGNIQVLRGVHLTLEAGRLVTLLGANGAGKTTTMRTIMGFLRPWRGEVRFDGDSLTGLSTEKIVRRGLCLVPERRELFPDMTVAENLEMGAYSRRDWQGIREDTGRVQDYFPVLRSRMKQLAGTLSGGEQQMLAIARALMSRPRVLLLDEPSLGLAPRIVEEIFGIIRRLNADGIGILLVEQNAVMALTIADHVYLLEQGRIAFEGPPDEFAEEDVASAYLG